MNVNCRLCQSEDTNFQVEIKRKPAGETDYGISEKEYLRKIYQCNNCSVYFSVHNYDFEKMYKGDYNASTYKNKLKATYDKIMELPKEHSDNALRCDRIIQKLEALNLKKEDVLFLDVGSGLCVFLGKMVQLGYRGYAVDPDQTSVNHALDNAKVELAYCGEIHDFEPPQKPNFLTMNKVLEHVPDPITLLRQALSKINSKGLCYLELPDGYTAQKQEGLVDRQEFYIEHYFAFTKKSMQVLMEKCGLGNISIESVKDPSGKYTLYGFGEIF